MKPRTSCSSSKRGFSLIELLTVIAVIAILAAILIPVAGRVRDQARASACVSNLRQIGTAVYLYAADHDDNVPPNINPERNPPSPDHNVGTYVADGRVLGMLVNERIGGRSRTNNYIDVLDILYCPAIPNDLYARHPNYGPPDSLGPDRQIMFVGYVWIYYPGFSPYTQRRNDKVTIDIQQRPYLFDFGWGGPWPAPLGYPVHPSGINILHIGGNVSRITHAEANRNTSYHLFYDYMTFRK